MNVLSGKKVMYGFYLLALFAVTFLLTVVTRSHTLGFDPVLLAWSALFLIFSTVRYRTLRMAALLALPLFILSMLPVVGFESIQNNPNNSNLLNVAVYWSVAFYLLIVLKISSSHKKEDQEVPPQVLHQSKH